jgi:hypothetical protein
MTFPTVLLGSDANLAGRRLLAVHGRPRFAKHTFIDELEVKIAPVYPDFLAAGTAAVPDGIC